MSQLLIPFCLSQTESFCNCICMVLSLSLPSPPLDMGNNVSVAKPQVTLMVSS